MNAPQMSDLPQDDCYLLDLREGVLHLVFNRPRQGNSVPSTAVPKLTALFRLAQARDDVRSMLISGRGRMFSAGGDVAGFARSLAQAPAERQADFGRRLGNLQELVTAVASFDRPMVASVRGAVAGAGLLYVLAADMVLGDSTALFVFAHQNVGLSPDGGVSALLPGIVGVREARRLLLTAAQVKAAEAHRLGLLTDIVEAEALDETSRAAAFRLAQAPQRAVRAAKRLINQAATTTLAEQLRAETAAVVACVADADFDEGVMAFLEKRKPAFPSSGEPGP